MEEKKRCPLKILSLFDGMACGMLAFQEACIEVDRYVAFEIDKYAVKTSSHNFPMIEHNGDVFNADFSEFIGFDFLIGGSPCTYWSIAQKNNRETEASGNGWELFSQYVRALHEAKPRWFIYENNQSMSKAIRESITDAFGFEPICINSALVSAQNRQRLYWVGVRKTDGSYARVDVRQPDDRGILLRDILSPDRHRVAGAHVINTTVDGKSQAVKAQYYKNSIANLVNGSGHYPASGVAEPVRIPRYGINGKSRCLTASYAHKGVGESSLASEAFPTNPSKQVRDYVAESVGYFATACEWDDHGRPIKAVSHTDGKTYLVYYISGGLITVNGRQCSIDLEDGYYIIRKFTVSECKRLQTVPE